MRTSKTARAMVLVAAAALATTAAGSAMAAASTSTVASGGRGNPTPATGTLDAQERADLAAMAEEEKLAHDVYVTLADRFPSDRRFSRIARSETQHLSALRTLLDRYSVPDPTAGRSVGDFADPHVEALYDAFLAQATSLTAAYRVGETIERTDISDLTDATTQVDAPDVEQVYAHLRMASEHHLAAFTAG